MVELHLHPHLVAVHSPKYQKLNGMQVKSEKTSCCKLSLTAQIKCSHPWGSQPPMKITLERSGMIPMTATSLCLGNGYALNRKWWSHLRQRVSNCTFYRLVLIKWTRTSCFLPQKDWSAQQKFSLSTRAFLQVRLHPQGRCSLLHLMQMDKAIF